MSVEYKIHQYDSSIHPPEELEEVLSKVYSNDDYTFVKLVDSVLPSGTYIAVVHYTVDKKPVAEQQPRVSANAEL